ncbi:hypothetical protein FrCorBMG51_11945 [Protofrankia coriariae]|uniref:PASTA domain-containing protein n=1 Tax=Protofrankia coriariae TaxID=1562887 RepID=A0ABR5F3P7_9ACTN|nr:hypothetical protein FrCorBMG51_11945 [Protofrankia coriariae]
MVCVLAAVLAVAVGVGYTATRPFLDDGSTYAANGYTLTHLNGETGQADATARQPIATGQEKVQVIPSPDGQVIVHNRNTDTVQSFDGATLTPNAPPVSIPRGSAFDSVEVGVTRSGGYVVNRKTDSVETIGTPQRGPTRIAIPDGILAQAEASGSVQVPVDDSVWVLTKKNSVAEVTGGRVARTVPFDGSPVGLTVADGHPVVVVADGRAYAVDGRAPRQLGKLSLAGSNGSNVVLGSWRGAGRYVVAVDKVKGNVAILDPRVGTERAVQLTGPTPTDLDSPATLGSWIYVPDRNDHNERGGQRQGGDARPRLWRINLSTGLAEGRPFDVPGQHGPFDLWVDGGRVWAGQQYDQRTLVVDADGHERDADKGARSEVVDSESRTGTEGPRGAQPTPSAPPPVAPSAPAAPPTAVPRPPADAAPPARRVTVPSFPKGTLHQQACDRLEQSGLRCQPLPAGDQDGLAADEVINTSPRAGALVPEGSPVTVSYVGPLRTPNVLGQPVDSACDYLRQAGLLCTTKQPSGTLALSPEQLGQVSGQSPRAGASVAKGSTVTLTYYDSIALPSFIGQPQGTACATLATYGLKCDPKEGGTAVGTGQAPGTVGAQDPPPSTVVKAGSTVTVTYYSGQNTVGDYVNPVPQTYQDACAKVRAAGFTCTPVEGVTAAGTGQQSGTVYAQSLGPGTKAKIGSTIDITYYSPNNTLSTSYVGWDINAACADISAHGFTCNPVPDLFPVANQVGAQDTPVGKQPIGSPVTLRYSPWQPVEYTLYQHNTLDVWALRKTPDGPPDGYGRRSVPIGRAYAPPGSENLPGARNINGFYCTAGKGRCNGLDVNHFYSYSQIGSYSPADSGPWNGPNLIARFMPCGLGRGERPVWRTWTAGTPRYYNLTTTQPAGSTNELLGCVW